jgi:hypothetical protein
MSDKVNVRVGLFREVLESIAKLTLCGVILFQPLNPHQGINDEKLQIINSN